MGIRDRNQSLTTQPKTNAFKLCYVLGVTDTVLRKGYEEEYIASGYTEKLKVIEGVEYLRALCKIRQILFRNYTSYNTHNGNYSLSVKSVSGIIIDEYIGILKDNDFDLYKHIDINSVCGTINELSKRINGLAYRVLDNLGVVHKEYVGVIFKYPEFDVKSIVSYLNKIKSKDNYPHGVVVFNTAKIEEHLGFMLFNDRNLYMSCHNLKGAYYDYENDTELWDSYNITEDNKESEVSLRYETEPDDMEKVPLFDGKSLKVLEGLANLTESNKVDSSRTTTVSSELCATYNTNSDKNYKEHTVENLLDRTYRLTHVYVDCDNIEYFKFLALLDLLSEADAEFSVKLFKDTKSSTLWDDIPIKADNVKLETINVDRLIGLKSMVDMAITTTICKDVYTKGISSIYLVSSDSDFLGLVKGVEIKELGIIYNKDKTNSEYLDLLANLDNTSVADLDRLNTKKVSKIYRDYSIKLMFIKHIQSVPLNKWTHDDCVNYILCSLNNACIGEIAVDDIASTVNMLKESVKITFGANGCEISIDEMTL